MAKKKPRETDIIVGALDERMRCIPRNDANEVHLIRMEELVDELRRSLNGKAEDNGE